MSGILVNTAKVANGKVENAQAIITTQDAQRKGFASFEIGNFFDASIPVLNNYSEFEVNGALSRFQSGDEIVKYLGNNIGDTIEEATAAPRNVPLYLCILPYTPNSFEFVVRGNITVAYDNAFGGIYENGTTTRIIGGCVYTGSSWINKWAINNGELLMTGVDPFIKMCSEGLDVNIRKIVGARQPGIVDTPISNYVPTASVAESGVIPGTFGVDYLCDIHVWIKYASSPTFALAPKSLGECVTKVDIATDTMSVLGGRSTLIIYLQRQHTDGTWIDYGSPVKITGMTSQYNNKSAYLNNIMPGTYRVRIESGWEKKVSGYGQYNVPTYLTYSCGVGQISVSILNVFGSKVDY